MAAALNSAVDGDTIENLTQLVEYIADHGGEATKMAEAIEDIEGQLSGIDKTTGSVKKYVDDAIDALDIETYASAQSVTDLTEVVNKKANVTDVYTKTEIDNKGYLTEHQNLDHKANKSDLDDLSAIVNGDESTEGTIKNQIKAVKDMIPSTEDINSLITGKGYATVEQVNNAVEGKASEEWVNGLLTSYVKTTDLPAPLLQSVSNEFSIDENKQLSIASVNVNKLVQSEGDELILNGGKA